VSINQAADSHLFISDARSMSWRGTYVDMWWPVTILPTSEPSNKKTWKLRKGFGRKVLRIDARHCRFCELHVGEEVDLYLDISQEFKSLEKHVNLYIS
jgi:hypothetical protein